MPNKRKSRPARRPSKRARSKQSKAAKKKTTRKPTPSQLMHRGIARSALTPTDGKTLCFRAINAKENENLTGHAVSGYLMPYHDIHGKPIKNGWRVRHLEEIKGKFNSTLKRPIRYTGPARELPHLYFPQNFGDWPGLAKDVTEPIYITEGEKKAAKMCKEGLPTIAVPGVWGWKSKKLNIKIIDDFKLIDWGYRDNPRPVYMVFDNDVVIKAEVLAGLNALSRELVGMCAEVYLKHLPPGNLKGADDFITAKGIEAFNELPQSEFAESAEIWKFQETVAYIKSNNYFVDVTDLRTFPDTAKLRQAFGNLSYEVPKADGEGMKTVYVVDEWLKFPHRRTHSKMTYAPGEAAVVDDALNTWRNWGCEPKPGDVKPFLDLVNFVFVSEPHVIDWFYQWLAYPLQNPGAKLLTGVLVWSQAQGVGKSFIGEIVRSIYGENASRIEKEDIVGEWNDWLVNKQFILGEEITGGDSRHVADKVKNMITRTTAQSKIKYQAAFEIEDRANYYLTSNHEDSLHLQPGERRFLVVHCDQEKRSDAFYEKIGAWVANGGTSHLFHYLLHEVDCSDFKPNAAAPDTAAKTEMQDLSKSDLDLFAHEIRDSPDEVLRMGRVVLDHELFTSTAITSLAATFCNWHVSRIAVSKALSRAGFIPRKVKTKGRAIKLWPLRNPDKWAKRSSKAWSTHFEKSRTSKFNISR